MRGRVHRLLPAVVAAVLVVGWATPIDAASLTLTPSSGAPGSATTVGGCGWAPGQAVVFLWDGELEIGATTPRDDPAGCIDAALTVPVDTNPGDHQVVAQQGRVTADATFRVESATAILTLSPSSGLPGSAVTAGGCGWAPGETVTFLWDGALEMGSTTPDADGCMNVSLTIPPDASPGAHEVLAQQGGAVATTTVQVNEADETDLTGSRRETDRAAWFMSPRVFPNIEFPRNALEHAHRKAGTLHPVWRAKDLVAIGRGGPTVPFEATGLSAWAPLGPAPLCANGPGECAHIGAPYSGRVTAIAAHPLDVDTVYVGNDGGGVWKTTDGGGSWVPLFDAMPTMDVGALAIDPFVPERVFVGTGNDVGLSEYVGLGVYVSDTGGTQWKKVGGKAFDGCSIARIAPHPQAQGVILLAARVVSPTATCLGGVYGSVDGGKTWARWLERDQASDVVIAGSNVFAGVFGEGVYASSIHQPATGAPVLDPNWQQVGGGLPTADVSRVVLAAAPSDPNRLYAVMGMPASGLGYLKGGWTSGNGGISWTPMNIPEATWTFLSLAVSPENPAELSLGTKYLYRSVDAGQSFTTKADAAALDIHVDVSALVFDAADRLLIGTDGGIYRAADLAEIENLNTNLSTTMVYPGISGSIAGGGPVLVGMQDNGIGLYSGSLTWHEIGFGGDGGSTAVNPQATNVLYSSANFVSYVRKSTDGGVTHVGLSHPDWATTAGFLSPVVMDLANPDRIYVGTRERLWRSVDAGGTWTPFGGVVGTVLAVAPAPANGNVVYYASHAPGTQVFVTDDDGATWTETAGNGLPDRRVEDIAVHPTRPNEAWVVMSGFGAGHVFHTTDYGAHWSNASGNLPDAPVNAIDVDSRRNPATLFAGTDVGVFVSFDSGMHWSKTGGGLPNAVVTDLLMDRATDTLLATTYGRGVWAAEVEVVHQTINKSDEKKAKQAWIEHATQFATTPPSGAPAP